MSNIVTTVATRTGTVGHIAVTVECPRDGHRYIAYCAEIRTGDGFWVRSATYHPVAGAPTCKRCLAKVERMHAEALKENAARPAPVAAPAPVVRKPAPVAPKTANRPAPRNVRAALRQIQLNAKLARKDRKAARVAPALVATGAPQTARVHLLAAGLPVALADRFAAAFSRGVQADAVRRVRVTNPKGKRHGSRVMRPTVKLIGSDAARARLATYRPKDADAAAWFAYVAA